MAKRKALSKKIRFEIFKRDGFTCQYCGASAPDVVLNVDHIKPVSKGGDNDLLNLITSCFSCNSGKSNRTLSDKSIAKKQRAQIEQLAERKQQIEMMLEWRDSLKEIDSIAVEAVESVFRETTGKVFTPIGRRSIKGLIEKYGLDEVLTCTEISCGSYFHDEDDAKKVFKMIGGIAHNRSKKTGHLHYIKGIVRNRMAYDDDECLELLIAANQHGASEYDLKQIALSESNFNDWIYEMNLLIGVLRNG